MKSIKMFACHNKNMGLIKTQIIFFPLTFLPANFTKNSLEKHKF